MAESLAEYAVPTFMCQRTDNDAAHDDKGLAGSAAPIKQGVKLRATEQRCALHLFGCEAK